VPSLLVQSPGVLALYAAGVSSGIVVDVGNRMSITPVIDGYLIDNAVRPASGGAPAEALLEVPAGQCRLGAQRFSERAICRIITLERRVFNVGLGRRQVFKSYAGGLSLTETLGQALASLGMSHVQDEGTSHVRQLKEDHCYVAAARRDHGASPGASGRGPRGHVPAGHSSPSGVVRRRELERPAGK
jgi:hypothetical protein